MIAKISRGGGFRGVAEYCLKKDGATLVGGNMSGSTPRELAQEFAITRGLNTRCEKPVFHASLSLADGERLTDEQWHEAASEFLEKMGFTRDQHQYVVVRHSDTGHDHVHVIANRINFETLKAVDLKHDFKRAHQACRALEQQFGLAPGTAKTKQRQLQIAKGGKADEARRRIDEALKRSRGDRDLLRGILGREGIELKENRQRTGRIAGVTYSGTDFCFKGSELGKGYSAAGLDRRLSAARRHAQAAAPSFAGALQHEAGRQVAKAVASAVPGLGSVMKAAKAVEKLTKSASARPGKSKSNEHEM